jgi:hypothetical protein
MSHEKSNSAVTEPSEMRELSLNELEMVGGGDVDTDTIYPDPFPWPIPQPGPRPWGHPS